jgi:anti-anti-sigma regulatory factor
MTHSEDDIWVFPNAIDFEKTALYTKKYREQKNRSIYFFDLSETKTVHTSFIGFLITVKGDLELRDGRLILNTSGAIEDLLNKMKLTDFFTSSKTVELLRKTA